MLKLMANFQVFQTIYHTNFCISTGIKTTANFLITDIETASFFASHCKIRWILGLASTAADDSSRMCKVLENKSLSDEARMESLENQLKDARVLAEEADKKYDEIAKKLQMVEADLDRAEERAETGKSFFKYTLWNKGKYP